ncbi:hypothetical protein [Ponticaulis profundi]|uniref:Uncharacterized protein n=1 Tax=Ponticaulis profundi TaxID=2665222 RepID=A0ABW1S8L8_9PROT
MMQYHKFLEASASAGLTLTTAATGTLGALAINLPFFTPGEYAAAVAGAGLAELGRLFIAEQAEEPTDLPHIWSRAVRGFIYWFVGSVVGLFLGRSFALLPILDQLGGAFIAGILGVGLLLFFISPGTPKRIFDAIMDRLKQ